MERKYQVTSATSVMKMIVTFNNNTEDGISEPMMIHVGVDYSNERVFFEGEPILGIDYQDLEQEILFHLRPPKIEHPKLSPEIMQKISDVRAGNYGTDLTGYIANQ